MLNDFQILELVEQETLIKPFDSDLLNPHSYDVTLDAEIKIPAYRYRDNIQTYSSQEPEKVWDSYFIDDDRGFKLAPLQFALATTIEYITLPEDLVGFVQGKSTIGRNGLQIECAGLIDASFSGNITLELFNMTPWPIVLRKGMRIGQIHFAKANAPMVKSYKELGHYNGQQGTTLPHYQL